MNKPISLQDCEFYHVIDLPGFGTQGTTQGWDLRGRFDEYIGNVGLADKTVLDVGAASGFLSFEAERAGAAAVTSYDAEGPEQYEYLPSPDRDEEIRSQRTFFPMMRNSYHLSRQLLGSKAVLVTGSIYDLASRVEAHQVSLIGQILVHLRDPLEALRQIALVTSETMIITEGSFHSDSPTAVFLGGKGNFYSFWHLSDEFYRQYLPILGFEVTAITKSNYRCNLECLRGDVEVWTVVARRSHGAT
jgi:hypothetical protein